MLVCKRTRGTESIIRVIAYLVGCSVLLSAVLGTGGCQTVRYLYPEKPPYDEELLESYNQTRLARSSSADVLSTIRTSESELVSTSESVVAAVGQKRNGYKTWMNMVAFDENRLTARRKYLIIIDDRPNPLEEPRKSVSFDCAMVLDNDVYGQPYANENARRIALLQRVQENAGKDATEVGHDNKVLNTCGMVINQILQAALVELEMSPALATRLSEPAGVDFSHINLGRGKIQMLVEGGLVNVKMRLGKPAAKWDFQIREAERKVRLPSHFHY